MNKDFVYPAIMILFVFTVFFGLSHFSNVDKFKELEYLERLYIIRKDIEYREQSRVIDSLISEQIKYLDGLD